MKRAFVTGVSGQDGAYLAKMLLEKGYEVYGTFRRSSHTEYERLVELGIQKDIKFVLAELQEFSNLLRAVEQVQPDEVYNLAAQSFVKASFEQPIYTSDVNALGTARLLEAIRTAKPEARFYQASTSEMYGKVEPGTICNEDTPLMPRSPYAISKLYAHWTTRNYREAYKLFACSGILFNHESPLRGSEFVTRKITRAVARIKLGLMDKVVLGNMDSKRDWGFAAEYVEAMHLMLQQDEPDDYVIATGEIHSVRDFVVAAFAAIDIDIVWQGKGVEEKGVDKKSGQVRVAVSPEFFRPAEVDYLIGDASKAHKRLGWQPKTSFEQLVQKMVTEDIRRADAKGR